MVAHLPPKLEKVDLSPRLGKLVESAKNLYLEKLASVVAHHKPPAYVVAAPGRVNLIGEHTDYTGGFVLPLAIEHSTVVYGTGFVQSGKGAGPTKVLIKMISDKAANVVVEEQTISGRSHSPPDESQPREWWDYVVGVIAQYLPDLPEEGYVLDLAMAISSDVPVGAGLSSSAALEVSTALLVECLMKDFAYSSLPDDAGDVDHLRERALRCQRAENEWAHAPCGIMDQLCCAGAVDGNLMLLDCRSLEITNVPMKKSDDEPVIVVTDSKVEHEIADSEYGLRRGQCNDALEAMQQVPLYHVLSLRDATLQDCKKAKERDIMDEVIYKRAKHVVTENQRTKECKTALKLGVWDRVGELMNASHASLRDDYEVSCTEIDFLVDEAQKYEGVYGSRITGGGFGGCTVSLVKKESVEGLVEKLKNDYKEIFSKDCGCFVTQPGPGARVLAVDIACKVAKN